MTFPKDAELLGTNSGELEIKGSGAHTLVRFSADGRRKLVADLTNTAAGRSRSRVYLLLESIRGAKDASVNEAQFSEIFHTVEKTVKSLAPRARAELFPARSWRGFVA